MNAVFPPLVWLIDPYGMEQVFRRQREHLKGSRSVVTQKEANELMENQNYIQAQRYADILNTMWFSFFYSSVIPLGVALSLVGLICYYWVDKYNLMRRRTVKETLSKEVSLGMIKLLEMSMIYCGIGSIAMTYSIFGKVYWQDAVVLVAGIGYSLLPMQIINEKLFKESSLSKYEEISYEVASRNFVTDYDRENPVTKKKAWEDWLNSLKPD